MTLLLIVQPSSNTYIHFIIGARASPTLAWLHCTRTCVCLLACLLGPATYRKSLHVLHYAKRARG